MDRQYIQEMVDKLKHDLYIRGIDREHCSETYYMVMCNTYETVIKELLRANNQA